MVDTNRRSEVVNHDLKLDFLGPMISNRSRNGYWNSDSDHSTKGTHSDFQSLDKGENGSELTECAFSSQAVKVLPF